MFQIYICCARFESDLPEDQLMLAQLRKEIGTDQRKSCAFRYFPQTAIRTARSNENRRREAAGLPRLPRGTWDADFGPAEAAQAAAAARAERAAQAAQRAEQQQPSSSAPSSCAPSSSAPGTSAAHAALGSSAAHAALGSAYNLRHRS